MHDELVSVVNCAMQLRARLLLETFDDIRHAFRGFRRSPGLVFSIVLTLALGIGANVTVFSIADAVLLKMLPVPEPERLVQILQPTPPARSGVRSTIGDGFDDRFTFEQFREMQKMLAPVAELLTDAAPSTTEAVLGGATETIRQSAVSGNYFRALAVNAVLGSVMAPGIDNEPGQHPQAVISHGFWKRRFAQDPNVIGRILQIGATHFEIIGVIEPGFFGLQVGSLIDVWTPITMETGRLRSGFPRWRLIARLRPDITPQTAMAPLQVWYGSRVAELLANRSKSDPGLVQFIKTAQLKTIPAAKGMSPLRKQYGEPIRILFALVAAVLLLACANVSSLLLARADGRQREMAVRLSIGASRGRILRQLFCESLLLAGIAAIVGTLAVHWTAPVLIALLAPSETPVQLQLDFDARLVGFLVTVLVFATIACGIVPALRASRDDIHSALKRATVQAAFVNMWQSRFLVGIQMALSLVLLITSALFVRTLLNLKTLDPGFDRNNVVWAYVQFRALATDDQLTLAWQDVLRRMTAIPGVESASVSIGGPLLAAPPYGRTQGCERATRRQSALKLVYSCFAGLFPHLWPLSLTRPGFLAPGL